MYCRQLLVISLMCGVATYWDIGMQCTPDEGEVEQYIELDNSSGVAVLWEYDVVTLLELSASLLQNY